jgi:Tol biopolymer transport system component
MSRLGTLALLSAGIAAMTAAAPAGADVFDGRIGFTSFRADPTLGNEGGDIFSMHADGSDVRRITPSPGLDRQPDWSPSGLHIAYSIRKPGEAANFEVARIAATGRGARRLTTTEAGQASSQPSWFPSGRGMLFRRSGPGAVSTIWQMGVLGQNPLLRLNPPHPPLYPSFSPDAKRILFTAALPSPAGRDRDRGIFVADASTGALTTLFDVPGAYDSAPAWSPDGERIAFESNADVGGANPEGDLEIWTMAADGSGALQLTRNALHDEGPAWSPDGGRMLAYTSGPDDLHGDIHVMTSEGRHLRQLTSFEGRDESPDWQAIPAPRTTLRCGDAAAPGPGPRDVRTAGGVLCLSARALTLRWVRAGRPRAMSGFAVARKGFGGTTRVVMRRTTLLRKQTVAFLYRPR